MKQVNVPPWVFVAVVVVALVAVVGIYWSQSSGPIVAPGRMPGHIDMRTGKLVLDKDGAQAPASFPPPVVSGGQMRPGGGGPVQPAPPGDGR